MSTPTVPLEVVSYGTLTASLSHTTGTITRSATVGQTLFVQVRSLGSSYPNSCTDTAGNTYTLIGRTTTFATIGLYATKVTSLMAAGVGQITITLQTSAAITIDAFVVDNISLVGSVSSFNSIITTTSITTGTITPPTGQGIVLTGCSFNYGDSPTLATAGFTKMSWVLGAGSQWQGTAYRTVNPTSAVSVLWNKDAATHNWASYIAFFPSPNSDFLAFF